MCRRTSDPPAGLQLQFGSYRPTGCLEARPSTVQAPTTPTDPGVCRGYEGVSLPAGRRSVKSTRQATRTIPRPDMAGAVHSLCLSYKDIMYYIITKTYCQSYGPTYIIFKTCQQLDLLGLLSVADRGVSGPWGPPFCGALCNGETQRLPAGGAGNPPVGSGAEPRRQTHFGNNILKIG